LQPLTAFLRGNARHSLPHEPSRGIRRWEDVSDITDYFLAHARSATRKARRMRRGTLSRSRQRVIARVYHLLAKEAAYASNVEHLDDFRAARRLERQIGSG
jgi:hypothetical protein